MIVSFASFTILAILFLANASEQSLLVAGGGALLATIVAHLRNPLNSVYIFCMATLLGPVIKVTIPTIGMFNIGDVFILILCFCYMPKWIVSGLYWGPYKIRILLLALLFLTTVLTSCDYAAVFSGTAGLLQVAFAYFVTVNEMKSREQAGILVSSFGYAVLVAAVVQLVSYAHGVNLNLGGSNDPVLTAAMLGQIEASFIKSSYFYGNFPILATSAACVGIQYLLSLSKSNRAQKIFWSIVVICAIFAGSLSSRSTLILVSLCSIALLVFSSGQILRMARLQHLFVVLTTFLILIGGLAVLNHKLLAGSQQSAYSKMFFASAATSFNERIIIWQESAAKCIDFPRFFFIGIGPNMTLKSLQINDPEVNALMTSSELKSYGGSFHSFFVDYVFQLGILSFVIVMAIVVDTLKRLYKIMRCSKYADAIAINCFIVIGVFLITGITLGAAWSKPYIAISQFFAVAHLLNSGRLGYWHVS
jgi:hypothetical protein